MVILTSADGKEFTTDKEVVQRSKVLRDMLEDVGETDQPIPVPNVDSSVLEKVLEFCEYHRNDPLDIEDDSDDEGNKIDDILEWDRKFIQVDVEMLKQLILASNYLDIKQLSDVSTKTAASLLKGKTPEEIRQLFGIENDFTPEEEEQLRRDNEWADPNLKC
ncbi:putative negative regulator sulfur controller-3 [Basidiobolus meristosporus CBS 931.73]|uniref:E3 ubiquitin ligase complex SCF subunit n=1 Tax=Basidiobolus meristosporus CBS 931.73 TaxID=1314790 RepID=A0A1Y1XT15_9FUNG|nr:putative negative regulator sulfur controller-3 [Basidiobolus meristosporus CBS 931.73]|eukprot:ORX88891.1 putative negative regulator sulfur controller-3 [Basidiobolus meristosporus CBS 931.73]